MPHRTRAAALLAAALLLSPALMARVQEHGGGGPGGSGPGGPGGPPGGMGLPGMGSHPYGPPPDGPRNGGTMNSLRNGLQVGPPGRWWDDKHFADDLGLKPEQQKRMDAIFNENRGTLASHFQTLQEEETRMDALARSATPEEDAIFAQIDRLAQAHASLEKALTHYLLGIRAELSADQVARLDSHR